MEFYYLSLYAREFEMTFWSICEIALLFSYFYLFVISLFFVLNIGLFLFEKSEK